MVEGEIKLLWENKLLFHFFFLTIFSVLVLCYVPSSCKHFIAGTLDNCREILEYLVNNQAHVEELLVPSHSKLGVI